MKKYIAALPLLAMASIASAQFEIREMSLNGPGYTDNLTVVPMDAMQELKNHSFSYDPDEIILNHQYAGAKHAIDRLSPGDQVKILLFIHNAVIEKHLAPNTIPSGEITLDVIVKKSPYDVSGIQTQEDAEKFIRWAYLDKLNSFVRVRGLSKTGNLIQMEADNYTDHRISRVTGNIKVSNSITNKPLMDAMVTEYGMGFDPGSSMVFEINMPSRVEGWHQMDTNLAYLFTVHQITFSDGRVFDADKFYLELKKKVHTLNPYPFTEI